MKRTTEFTMPFKRFRHYICTSRVHPCTSLHCMGSSIFACCRFLPDHSDSAVSPPVTCVNAVTVHLRSQCSGGCSDVQETAEGQS